MAELAALYALGAGGVATQKQHRDFQKQQTIPRAEYPVDINPYNMHNFANSKQYIVDKNLSQYERMRAFPDSNVVGRNTKAIESTHKGPVYSEMAGRYFEANSFVHNNMQPYFGSHVKQNTDVTGNKNILENYTGANDDIRIEKKGVPSFFAPVQGLTNIHGSKISTDFLQSRMVVPTIQNNVQPVPQIRVGKGLGLSTHTAAGGGFHQFEVQDMARNMYKTVDDLRVANKPKIALTAPINTSGQRGSKRTSTPIVALNRYKAHYHENLPMFPTSAPIQKESLGGIMTVKDTHRAHALDDPYFAPGISTIKAGTIAAPMSHEPSRRELHGVYDQVVNIRMPSQPGLEDDHGRDSMVVPVTNKEYLVNTERDGIVTSIVKALISPIKDVLRPTKAEFFVRSHREHGPLQPQQPNKLQVHHVDGPRVTVKETLLQESDLTNLAGPTHVSLLPTDEARVTRKETSVHDTHDGFLATGVTAGKAYDPREVTRTTRKETISSLGTNRNMDAGVRKGRVSDRAKTRVTVKETTIDVNHAGIVGTLAAHGHITQKYDAKHTLRETTHAEDHFGMAVDKRHTGAYIAGVDQPQNTNKEVLADNEHYGGFVSDHKREGMVGEFATPNADKEIIATQSGQQFGPSGPKASPVVTNIHATKNVDRTIDDTVLQIDRVHNKGPLNLETESNVDLNVEDNRAFELDILSQLEGNPYIV